MGQSVTGTAEVPALCVRRFSELSADELYALLRLRVSVFVVEQQCPYPELDGLDQAALHVWLQDADGIAAYLRVMDRSENRPYVSIGRVLSVRRREGLATRLLKEGIRLAQTEFHAESVYLEAQVYARSLYEKQGFRQISDEFLEDGIPHVKMLLECGK